MLSIIIVNYNSETALAKCLASLSSISPDKIEVFVIDNHSSLFDAQKLSRTYPYAKIIINPTNCGFAKANNQAYALSKGKYILMLNPDVEIGSDSIQAMMGHLDNHKNVAAVGPHFLDKDGKDADSGYYNRFPQWQGVFSYYFKFPTKPLGLPDKETEIDQIPGACLMVKREVIDKIGFLDERFFVWMEDVDFCFRMKKAGWKLVYLPQAAVKHVGGASFSTLKKGEKGLIWARSTIMYFFKNRNIAEAILFTLLFSPKVFQFILYRISNK